MDPIFSTFDLFTSIKKWASRIIFLTIMGIALRHFSENPTGLTIFSILCFLVAAIISEDKIDVYENHFEYNKMYFFNLVKLKERIEYKDIKAIKTEGYGSGISNFIAEIFHTPFNILLKNDLEILLLNNETETLRTRIVKSELHFAVAEIEKYADFNNPKEFR